MTRGQAHTPYVEDADFRLLNCDVLDGLRSLPDESVHCVVTSPPYWGLRDYSTEGQLGLEPTPEEYVARMVGVFREVRRVLRADGSLWLNIGDSYNSRLDGSHGGWNGSSEKPQVVDHRGPTNRWEGQIRGLGQKQLLGMPWRLAFALQADGWYLRSDIIWSKPNPMPESVTDRPTKAHEYVFLLTKGPRYFFDQEAVREPHTPDGRRKTVHDHATKNSHPNYDNIGNGNERWPNGGRNVRSVWEIATQPYPEAHFATYPEELVRRCILAGTSERGCCPLCGTPWQRETETSYDAQGRTTNGPRSLAQRHATAGFGQRLVKSTETLGWRPACDHDGEPVPATILDPFLGSGTTAYVARKHGRRSIGIELNGQYAELAAKRMQQQSLFAVEAS